MSEKINKRDLPAISDILSGDIEVYKKQSQLNVLLNQEPKESWIKIHPIAKTKYIPIERIEFLLTSIFDFWNVEIKNISLIANSVVVTIRLHYKSLVDGTIQYQDGLGAAPLQTDQGAGATDFNSIKSSAVMIAAPAAESFAIKDAAEKLGKLFGKDLNRKDKIGYDNLLNKHNNYSNLEPEEDEKPIIKDDYHNTLFDKKIN
jgi:hypothetical protein